MLTLLLLLCSCSFPTAYQQLTNYEGYSELKLKNDSYKVIFKGNRYTSSERSVDFVFLRSVEISINNGFNYIKIIEDNNYTDKTQKLIPFENASYDDSFNVPILITINKEGDEYQTQVYNSQFHTYNGYNVFTFIIPTASISILFLKSKPENSSMIIDALYLKNILRKKYNL